jgi:hypothetical protein
VNPLATGVEDAAAASHTLASFGTDYTPSSWAFATTTENANSVNAGETIIQVAVDEELEVRGVDQGSGFAPPATGEGMRHTLIRILPNPPTSPVTARSTVAGGTGTIVANPFETAGEGAAVQTLGGVTTYVRTPTSLQNIINVLAAIGASPNHGYYLYQAQGRDKAGNLTPIIHQSIFVNDENEPAITGLNATATYTGGAQALYPFASEDPGEVLESSFDNRYPGVSLGGAAVDLRWTFNRPADMTNLNGAVTSAQPLSFDDIIEMPFARNLRTGFFLRSLQGVDADHNPAAAPVRPNEVRGRVYNVFGSRAASTATHRTAFAAGQGFSDYFAAPILPTQVAAGTNWNTVPFFGDPVTDDQSWMVTNVVAGPAVDGNRTFTLTLQARGTSGQFLNPFPEDLDPGIVRADNGFIFPVATGEKAFTHPFPSADDGVRRDFRWTVQYTQPVAAGLQRVHAFGMNANGDVLIGLFCDLLFTPGDFDCLNGPSSLP